MIKQQSNFIIQRMDSQQKSLLELLSDPDITAEVFFSQEGIVPKIKSKIQVFVDFCIRNQKFTQQMIKLGLQVPTHSSQQQKKISFAAQEILTYDHDTISELFIIDKSKERIRLYSDDDEDCEQIICDATGQVSIIEKTTSQQKSDFAYKYRNLLFVLEYLDKADLDQNCVNYTAKVLFTVIRIKPEHIFEFFHQRSDILKKMISLTSYPSISFALVKLLNEVDQEKYRIQKSNIINIMLKQIRNQIASQQFSNYLEFIEDVFNKNRFRSEEIDQIKIISQQLVEKQIIDFMLMKIREPNAHRNVINNCIAYLLKVVQRMNIDEQDDPYSYSQQKNLQPTMNFACKQLYGIFENLIALCSQINRQNYTSKEIYTYYQLLDGLTKNSRFAKMTFTEQQRYSYILSLLNAYLHENPSVNGLIKSAIIKITERIIKLPPILGKFPKQIHNLLDQIDKNKAKQSESYQQKLNIMFSREKMEKCVLKYLEILHPNNYTSNREFKVYEFGFAYDKKKQIEDAREIENKNASISTENILDNDTLNDEGEIKNGDDQKKVCINLDTLDNKINAMKMKKKSKASQEEKQTGEQPQQEDESIPDLLPSQSPGKPKNGINYSEAQQKSIQLYQQPICIQYYVKHPLLF